MPSDEDEVFSRSSYQIFGMLILGIVCLLTIVALLYFTIQALVGRRFYGNVWIDIPGRLAILTICYYVAGLCGFFPLPGRRSRQSLLLWRRETWKRFFRCFLPTPTLYSRFPHCHDTPPLHGPTVPVVPGTCQERHRENAPNLQRRSESTSVPERTESRVIDHSQSDVEDIFKFDDDSSLGCVNPTLMGNFPEPQDSLLASEGAERAEGMSFEQRELYQDEDAPPLYFQTENTESALERDFPRFPWGCMRCSDTIPEQALRMHQKNLQAEKRVTELQERLQREYEEKYSGTAGPSTERRAVEAEANSQLLQNQSGTQTRSRRLKQSSGSRGAIRKRSSASKSDQASRSDKMEQQGCPDCCQRISDLEGSIADRILSTASSAPDTTESRQIDSSVLEAVGLGSAEVPTSPNEEPQEEINENPVGSQKDES